MGRGMFEGTRKYKNDPPIRIFKSNILEFFTWTPFWLFFSIWSILFVLFSWYVWEQTRDIITILEWGGIGIIVWLLTEYILHRFVFHWDTNWAWGKHLVYVLHGNHHLQPNHPLRTLFPITAALPVAIGVELLMVHIWGTAKGNSMWLGFVLGYLLYDIIHYGTHNFGMKSKILKWIRRHHMLHHYAQEDRNYQISFPLVDYLFLSYYKNRKKQRDNQKINKK